MKLKTINGTRVPYEKSERELLADALGATPECWAAIYALGFVHSQNVADFLQDQLSSKDWTMRRAIAEAIRFQNSRPIFIESLIQLLNDTSPQVQRTACETLCEMRVVKALPFVRALLGSEDPEMRQIALRGLNKIWNDDAWPPVFLRACEDGDLEVRKTASRVLRQHVNPLNWRDLFQLWHKDGFAEHRVWACQILGAFGYSRDSDFLTALSVDENGHVRKAAAMAREKMISRN